MVAIAALRSARDSVGVGGRGCLSLNKFTMVVRLRERDRATGYNNLCASAYIFLCGPKSTYIVLS
jgi:hypothetical protein